MKSIGGYLELELSSYGSYHKNALALNTARNCFLYIIQTRSYNKVFIPYFTCDVLLEILLKNRIDFEFYSIDSLFNPKKEFHLEVGEAFLYTNYWGLKSDEAKKLVRVYGEKLIIDNSQAFYANPLDNIDTFYSPRKFFGVPDGGYLYINNVLEKNLNRDISFGRMSHLLKRIDLGAEKGYDDFRKNDDLLNGLPILRMSNLTEHLLASIDYQKIADIRVRNFNYLHLKLGNYNEYHISINQGDIPMVYPFLILSGSKIRDLLIMQKIFIAKYWPNVLEWCPKDCWEYFFAENMLPLPIDQRLSIVDLDYIVELILSNL